jgi:hypothetical protein
VVERSATVLSPLAYKKLANLSCGAIPRRVVSKSVPTDSRGAIPGRVFSKSVPTDGQTVFRCFQKHFDETFHDPEDLPIISFDQGQLKELLEKGGRIIDPVSCCVLLHITFFAISLYI